MKRHAYLVMAHGGFEQLAALLALIDDSRNDIFLHIDKKAGKVDEASLFAAVSLSRLNLIPRVSVNWGGYSQIACVFALLQAALNAGDYAYLHLISGADLPLRTQDAMHAFFDSHDGREFIEFSGMAIDANTKCRLSLYHFFQEWPRKGSIYRRMEDASLRFQMRKGVDRTLGEQSVFQKGATWFSITGALARFAVENERA
ncbi:MAG: beta-1,6-N-acetylglucosaminyltransferase, partial [Oscillospiraceae bacterium]